MFSFRNSTFDQNAHNTVFNFFFNAIFGIVILLFVVQVALYAYAGVTAYKVINTECKDGVVACAGTAVGTFKKAMKTAEGE